MGMVIIHTREFQNITIMAQIRQKINLYKICAGLCLFDTPHWPALTSAFLTRGRSTRYLFEQHLMRIIFISCQTCFLGVESCIALNISWIFVNIEMNEYSVAFSNPALLTLLNEYSFAFLNSALLTLLAKSKSLPSWNSFPNCQHIPDSALGCWDKIQWQIVQKYNYT